MIFHDSFLNLPGFYFILLMDLSWYSERQIPPSPPLKSAHHWEFLPVLSILCNKTVLMGGGKGITLFSGCAVYHFYQTRLLYVNIYILFVPSLWLNVSSACKETTALWHNIVKRQNNYSTSRKPALLVSKYRNCLNPTLTLLVWSLAIIYVVVALWGHNLGSGPMVLGAVQVPILTNASAFA